VGRAAHEESATHEPLCAVKAAVDSGIISPERYNSYLGMLEEDRKFR
jgi:ribosome biogenesis GTPase